MAQINDAKVGREPKEIGIELEKLSKNVEISESLYSEIETAISPVLNSLRPDGTECAKCTTPESPLAISISELNNKLSNLNSNMRVLLGRIQL